MKKTDGRSREGSSTISPPGGRPRSIRLSLSESEFRAWNEAAGEEGYSLVDWLKDLVNAEIELNDPPEAWGPFRGQLRLLD